MNERERESEILPFTHREHEEQIETDPKYKPIVDHIMHGVEAALWELKLPSVRVL